MSKEMERAEDLVEEVYHMEVEDEDRFSSGLTVCGLVCGLSAPDVPTYRYVRGGVNCPTCIEKMRAAGLDLTLGGEAGCVSLAMLAAAEQPKVPEQPEQPEVPAPTQPTQPLPTYETMLQVGALIPEGKPRSQEIQDYLDEQRKVYQGADKDRLIDALLQRDEAAIRQGQEAAGGQLHGRLIKEFLRGVLHLMDHQEISRLTLLGGNSKSLMIEGMLQALGAPPTDLRELKRNGTGLGELGPVTEDPELAIQQPKVPQLPSVAAAEDIRAHRAEHVAQRLNQILEEDKQEQTRNHG